MLLERKSGILAHPTAFGTKFGIGDLGQGAYNFVDFLEKSQQKLWQTLPLGPTSFGDSPYQCFSTFAGNYYLISPEVLVSEGYLNIQDIEEIPDFDNYKIDYGKVIKYKVQLLKKAYEGFKVVKSKKQKEQYEKFCIENDWLEDFSLFMALKDYYILQRKDTFESPEYKAYKEKYKEVLTEDQVNDYFYGGVWNSWDEELVQRKPKAIQSWLVILEEEIGFYKFLQYEFFRQWNLVKNYANQKGIEIIGDIPIFVAMDSADVWANSNLFHLDKEGTPVAVAGVPPDYFSETGQLWGNPLYDWKANKKEGYKWWIKRIKAMNEMSDIIRIDHFRAFDEYWAVPFGDKTAENGKWEKGPSKDLFKAIKNKLGEIPIIAEDLGVMTKGVEKLRDGLDLPGMKILQFAFDSSEKNAYLPHNFKNSNCVVYTGTHDNDTTLGWYEKISEVDKDLLRRYLNVSGEDVVWDLIRLCWSSSGAYAIVPVQDLLSQGSDCRMNTPGEASGNWQYRFKNEDLTGDIVERLVYLNKLFER